MDDQELHDLIKEMWPYRHVSFSLRLVLRGLIRYARVKRVR